ncbi:MAG: dephospho-CoA kinase, partial [Lachnospiraceae bacterium]|nr:dephospho-CoA kinase [Lachnospiraceae bacterium]
MVIGIVGKIGSGKSEVVDYLHDAYGAAKFSCDEVAKEIMVEEGYKIDDKQDIFTNENILEKIRIELHPKVFSRINENIN